MKRLATAWLAIGAVAAASGSAAAHHSFAMFDQDHKGERVGVVKEFKLTAPHVFIMLEIKEEDGTANIWALEGEAPAALVREGWSAKSLKAGDEIKLMVAPLRSGAAGGAWVVKDISFSDGKPIVAHP